MPDSNARAHQQMDAAAPAQQPWKYTPQAQERIQALELEVRQLTEQIAGLRGGWVAKEYAELPESCYEDDAGLKTYDSGDMRTFADATHALRIQQPAPSAAPAEPTAEIENLRKALQFYADGDHFGRSDDTAWDTVSGEPQNWWCDEAGTATVEDGSLARMALAGHPFPEGDLDDETPTPQADSQPAPVAAFEVADAMADSQYLAGVSAGWNAANADDPNAALQKLHESRTGYLKPLSAARAPADSVLEDAAPNRRSVNRYCRANMCLESDQNHEHDCPQGHAARKQGGS